MLKRITNLFLIFTIAFLFSTTSLAFSGRYVRDEADILTDEEEIELNNLCADFIEEHDVPIFILTTDGYEVGYESSYPIMDYVQDYGEKNYGYEYLGFIIDMNDREYYFDVAGSELFDEFTDARQETITQKVASKLSNADYKDAFSTFINSCDNTMSPTPAWQKRLVISGFVSLVITVIIASIMLYAHKTSRIATSANNFISGHLNLTKKSDTFINTYTTKTQRVQSSSSGSSGTSSHRSSSGHLHSGRGGHF